MSAWTAAGFDSSVRPNCCAGPGDCPEPEGGRTIVVAYDLAGEEIKVTALDDLVPTAGRWRQEAPEPARWLAVSVAVSKGQLVRIGILTCGVPAPD